MHVRSYRHVKEALSSVMEASCNKYGFITYRVVSHWKDIVGDEISKLSFPLQVIFEPAKTIDGTLVVGVTNPGFGLEIQSSEALILSKLAIYFGYKAVARIKIKISQKPAIKESIVPENTDYNTNVSIAPSHNAKIIINKAEYNNLSNLINTIQDGELVAALSEIKDLLFLVSK